MKDIRPDHIAIYIRWSTEDQGDGTTLEVQKEGCTHYVLSQGWRVRDDLVYVDDGYSGGSLDRPAMTALRKAIRRGDVDCVVVYKLDRLSRSVVDTVNLVLSEWEDITYVKSAREPIDTTSPMGKQFFYMLVTYAEWERSVIRDRLFSGRQKRAEQGRSPGIPRPYGYANQHGEFVIVPEEAKVVQETFTLAAEGHSVRQITLHLNEKGYPTKRGGRWNTSMVSKMLRNPIYMGRLVWGRTRINPRHKKHPDEPRLKKGLPHVILDGFAPPIVSAEQFEQVQSSIASNKKIPPAVVGSEHLLSGVLACGECGGAMQFNASADGRWRYYRCSRRLNRQGCNAPSIPAVPLESAVVGELKKRYGRRATARARETQQAFLASIVERLEQTLSGFEAELRKLDQQEERINRDYRQEKLSAADRTALLAEVRSDRTALLKQKQLVETDLEVARSKLKGLAEEADRTLSLQRFEALPPTSQKQIIQALISRITASRDPETRHIQMEFEWADEREDQFPSLALAAAASSD